MKDYTEGNEGDAKGEIEVGSGVLKGLENNWWGERTEETQLDCEFFEGVGASHLGA